MTSRLSCNSGVLGCVPPGEADKTPIMRACGGQVTSWDNLCTGRVKCSPESLMKSSGSPMTQRNLSAFSNGPDRLDSGWILLQGGLFKRFLLPPAHSALLHKVTHCSRATEVRGAVPSSANYLPSPTATPGSCQDFVSAACGLSWSSELESGRPLNSCNYLFQGKWITAQSCMIRSFGGWGPFGWLFFTELLKDLTLQFCVLLI